MKNDYCVFKRSFKIAKKGEFVLGIIFFCFRDIDVFVLCKLGK